MAAGACCQKTQTHTKHSGLFIVCIYLLDTLNASYTSSLQATYGHKELREGRPVCFACVASSGHAFRELRGNHLIWTFVIRCLFYFWMLVSLLQWCTQAVFCGVVARAACQYIMILTSSIRFPILFFKDFLIKILTFKICFLFVKSKWQDLKAIYQWYKCPT